MNRSHFPTLSFLLLLTVCTAITSCGQKEQTPIAEHVILIGLDGWGSYSLPEADMPAVKRLMENGAYTLEKRSVLPSSSAVNWASMFMGAGPELHGYTEWGSKVPELPSRVTSPSGTFPTIFRLLRDARPDAEIGCLYDWDGIKYLIDTLAMSHHAQGPDYTRHPEALCDMAVRYIRENRPVLAAICFDNPDHVGHAYGHGTPEYYSKLTELDGYIARIIQSVEDAGMTDSTIFIITADHGGIGKGHGGKTMDEMQTPFIVCGKGVRQGMEFHESMMQYDVASTIARIFALEQPQVWVGRPMTQIFL